MTGLFDGLGSLNSGINAGRIELRLQIEGYADEWVTSLDLIDEVNGPAISGTHRRMGLLRDGCVINEKILFPKGISEATSGITFKIVDIGSNATSVFFKNPTFEAPIAATLLCTDTTASVQSGYGTYFSSGSLYYIATETIKVAGVSSDNIFLDRGKFSGEIPFSCSYYFPDSAFSTTDRVPYFTDQPISLLGRRVSLYAYTDTEIDNNYANKGNLVYRGLITSDIEFSDETDTTYQFTTDPIMKILEGNIGTDQLGAFEIFGIYIPDSMALSFLIYEYNGADYDHKSMIINQSGFFPTIDDLAASINSKLAFSGSAAGMSNTYRFERYQVDTTSYQYGFTYQTNASAFAAAIHTINGVLKTFDTTLRHTAVIQSFTEYSNYFQTTNNRAHLGCYEIATRLTDPNVSSQYGFIVQNGSSTDGGMQSYILKDGNESSIKANTKYFFAQSKFQSSPGDSGGTGDGDFIEPQMWPSSLGYYLSDHSFDLVSFAPGTTIANPANIIYYHLLENPVPNLNYESFIVTKTGDKGNTKRPEEYPLGDPGSTESGFSPRILSRTTAGLLSITYQQDIISITPGRNSCLMEVFPNGTKTHNISLQANLGYGVDVSVFIQNLLLQTPNMCSLTWSPLITPNDIDLDQIKAQLQIILNSISTDEIFPGVSLRDFYTNRFYRFFSKSKPLKDILAGEALILGCYFCLLDNGKIGLRKMEFASQSQPAILNFSYGTNITDESQPSFKRFGQGYYNSIALHWGYDYQNDQFNLPLITLNQNDAIIRNGYQVKSFDVNLYSTSQYDPSPLTANFFAAIMVKQFVGFLKFISSPYGIATIETKNAWLSSSIGTVVSLTNDVLPNYRTSKRGLNGVKANIQSRKLDLESGFASYELITFENGNLYGYSPTLQFTGAICLGIDGANTFILTSSINSFSPFPFNTAGNPPDDPGFFLSGNYGSLTVVDSEAGEKYKMKFLGVSGNPVSSPFNYQLVRLAGTLPVGIQTQTEMSGFRYEFVNYLTGTNASNDPTDFATNELSYAYVVNLSESNISKYGT